MNDFVQSNMPVVHTYRQTYKIESTEYFFIHENRVDMSSKNIDNLILFESESENVFILCNASIVIPISFLIWQFIYVSHFI